jgi:hypothetical protein
MGKIGRGEKKYVGERERNLLPSCRKTMSSNCSKSYLLYGPTMVHLFITCNSKYYEDFFSHPPYLFFTPLKSNFTP